MRAAPTLRERIIANMPAIVELASEDAAEGRDVRPAIIDCILRIRAKEPTRKEHRKIAAAARRLLALLPAHPPFGLPDLRPELKRTIKYSEMMSSGGGLRENWRQQLDAAQFGYELLLPKKITTTVGGPYVRLIKLLFETATGRAAGGAKRAALRYIKSVDELRDRDGPDALPFFTIRLRRDVPENLPIEQLLKVML